ncbi:metalloproteinase inhibitor 2 isoform X3 [Ochotona curzoniae]|uniref:metalloproteinase inhibitor 2 isoform X3 n=1 Tax=Ochotona curzoniae TaxID=130825 RepID=UPI001B350313|nr:metalloproteinase inhibitor 2 isoform X3 [Ochotona curzoniae]
MTSSGIAKGAERMLCVGVGGVELLGHGHKLTDELAPPGCARGDSGKTGLRGPSQGSLKMFKGPDKDIEFIYTAPSSAVCGVSLDMGGKKEYLIAGKAEGDGKMHVTLCDFIVPWDSLSTTQKKSLNHRYQMGCECKITRCPMTPCYISSPDECLWMDWVTEKNINGHQAKFFACIKRSDGSCAWYRGAAPPKQEFLDIEDP